MSEFRYSGTALINPTTYNVIGVSANLRGRLAAQGLGVSYVAATADSSRNSGFLSGYLVSFGVTSNEPDSQVASKVNNALYQAGIVRHYIEMTGKFGTTTTPTTTTPTTTTTTTTGDTYTVKRGDTLSSIARKFGTTWQVLATLNNLSNPNQLRIGQVLRTGQGSGVVTGEVGVNYPQQTQTPTPQQAPQPQPTADDEPDNNTKAWGQSIMTIGLVAVGAFIVLDVLKGKK